MGKLLIIAGIVLILVGALISTGALSWFGKLPGDIHIDRPSTQVFIPITSMLVISAILSLLAFVLRRFF